MSRTFTATSVAPSVRPLGLVAFLVVALLTLAGCGLGSSTKSPNAAAEGASKKASTPRDTAASTESPPAAADAASELVGTRWIGHGDAYDPEVEPDDVDQKEFFFDAGGAFRVYNNPDGTPGWNPISAEDSPSAELEIGPGGTSGTGTWSREGDVVSLELSRDHDPGEEYAFLIYRGDIAGDTMTLSFVSGVWRDNSEGNRDDDDPPGDGFIWDGLIILLVE